ncbi:hypothetical protein L4D04_19490 [Photobacterium angustum]|uniref:Uncharacterized protein n=1 Tax=Photobacterium angustum (strain S14 / CCUG 15956) TaxID=314292 RepID=Q1ZR20_PHOAS|nr:hypothetical protein [Photobacterium angustum]EAS64674.1 hypothetical protein VAS14_03123 [Photobacterium angustum S14]
MFYNSKKLIDEKVLQQYYFERFMLSDTKDRKILLPTKYHSYAFTNIVKGLNPEVRVGQKTDGGSHITDFVLYPMPTSGLPKLNIEMKWSVKDFEQQPERFEHYNNTISQGFVVAVKDDKYSPEYLDNGKIPVVYLCPEDFKKWFTKKSYAIVSQALANKLGSKPTRLSGEKFWVICIVGASNQHYLNHGRPYDIWAFRDNNHPKNIMNILDGDYVIFVRFDHCEPGRAVYPYSNNIKAQFKKSRGGYLTNEEISWALNLIDIRKVNKGYHLNYSIKPPYQGFDEEWLNSKTQSPETKNYTQFITFNKPNGDQFEYIWSAPAGITLDRKLFIDDNLNSESFVKAIRQSMNTRGDACEISRSSFESVLHLLSTL